jgi:hypothetical protein
VIAGIASAGLAAQRRRRIRAGKAQGGRNGGSRPTRPRRSNGQPKTMAQADLTQFRTRSGGTAVRVPTQLWSGSACAAARGRHRSR